MFTRLLVLVLIGMVLGVGLGESQYAADDILVADLKGGALWGVTPVGAVYTVSAGLSFTPMSLMCAPDNRGVWVSGFGPNLVGHTVGLAPDGTVTTLFSTGFYGLDVDGAGDVLGAGRTHITRVKYGQLQTVFNGNPIAWIRGGAIDLGTGAYIAHDDATYFYRFDYYPKYALSLLTSGIVKIPPPVTGLHPDPESGEMMCTRDHQVVGLNTGSPAAAHSLMSLGSSWGLNAFGCLERDPADGSFLAPACAFLKGQPAAVLRIDTRKKVITTVATFPPAQTFDLAGIVIARSRHLAGTCEAQPGQPYSLRVSVPNDAFAAYIVAMSFGFRPGIRVAPRRKVYLNPDPLFMVSLSNTGIFQGFQGILDHQGEAIATLAVPNLSGLRGTRLYAAAMTIRRGQVSVISEPVGFTIR